MNEPSPSNETAPAAAATRGSAAANERRLATRGRSWARRLALQALYQRQLTAHPPAQIIAQFSADQDTDRADMAYFSELLTNIVKEANAIDAALTPYLDRPLAQVDPVERAILWIAGYELMRRIDIPYRVIINESVELAKRFGADQSHRFVNGVLDKAAQALRTVELANRPTP